MTEDRADIHTSTLNLDTDFVATHHLSNRNMPKAREAGDTEVAAVIVGDAVDLVHAEETASEIVSRIFSDAETLLRGAWAGS